MQARALHEDRNARTGEEQPNCTENDKVGEALQAYQIYPWPRAQVRFPPAVIPVQEPLLRPFDLMVCSGSLCLLYSV